MRKSDCNLCLKTEATQLQTFTRSQLFDHAEPLCYHRFEILFHFFQRFLYLLRPEFDLTQVSVKEKDVELTGFHIVSQSAV